MAVLRPLKVVIENYPEGQVEELDARQQPRGSGGRARARCRSRASSTSSRTTSARSRRRSSSASAPAREVRLRYAYLVKCDERREGRRRRGRRAALHLRSRRPRGGAPRRPQGARARSTGCRRRSAAAPRCGSTIACSRARAPDAGEGADFLDQLNPARARGACAAARSSRAWPAPPPSTRFQFERLGYFCVDPDSTPGARSSTAPSPCATRGRRSRRARRPSTPP